MATMKFTKMDARTCLIKTTDCILGTSQHVKKPYAKQNVTFHKATAAFFVVGNAILLDHYSNSLSKHAKTPDHLCDDRGFLRYLVELDRIELTAS